jgi:RNA ligase
VDKELILLVGPQGSGKTTYCREHLPEFHRISQDDLGRGGHAAAFEEALARGEPRVVVDRINYSKTQRKHYLDPAKRHGYRTRIVWLNADRAVCLRRCKERTDHPTLPPAEAEKALATYFRNFQVPSRREADELVVVGPAPVYSPVIDLRDVMGDRRHLIIGDIHGCLDELCDLLNAVRFYPAEDVLISVGDIVDRGPDVRGVVEILRGLPRFHMVRGNHEDKFLRYLLGNAVKVGGGLETTVESFAGLFPPDLADWLAGLPLIVRTPSGFVVHAGFDPEMPPEEQSEADCLYMRFYGGKTYFDEINGRPWYELWPADADRVFFGHIPLPPGSGTANAVALDGGCVFGGELRAYDSQSGAVVAVPARKEYAVSAHAPSARPSAAEALRRREEYVASGLLRKDVTDDGELVIYTYTDQCTYEMAWDDVTRHSRGHVFNVLTGECVARPFPKFFNLGENQEALPERFPWDRPYDVYEKMDGWLGVLYRHEGRFKVASRGSFHSGGAAWATEFLGRFDLSCLPDAATLCFEIIHPHHQIILSYDEPTLVILAAFDRLTGDEYARPVVVEWARQIGLPVVPMHAALTMEDLLRHQKERERFEGFVIRFADGRRAKVKTEWYLRLARLMADLSPIAVWEAMAGGKVRTEYMHGVAEELRPTAEKYRAILEGQYARQMLELETVAGPILARANGDRRAVAEELSRRAWEVGELGRCVFALLDGKLDRVERWAMDRIYPRGNRFTAEG